MPFIDLTGAIDHAAAMVSDPDFFIREVRQARRFHLDQRQALGRGTAVVCGGWELCGRGYRVARDGFPWLGLELVAEGAGRLVLDGREHPLSAGSVFTYGRTTAHQITSDPRRPLRKYFIDLGHGAVPLLERAGLAPGTLSQVAAPVRAVAAFDLLIDVGAAGGPDAETTCAALATALVLIIGGDAVAPGQAQEPAYATYLRCRAWLEERGADITTLAGAAKACGVSTAYLCRLFRRYDRDSPWRLVRRRRLQKAAELLADDRKRIRDVADELGYADAFHFSRAFSRAFGVSPQAFRRQRR